MDSIDKILLQSETSDLFIRQLMGSLTMTTKASNAIPCGEGGSDFEYFCTFPNFLDESDECSDNVAKLINNICSIVDPNKSIQFSEDLQNTSVYEQVVDVIDSLLASADLQLDQITKSRDKSSSMIKMSLSVDKEKLISNNIKNIPKSQLKFLTEIDNSRQIPFRPKLQSKPHAKYPLDLRYHLLDNKDDGTIGPSTYFNHPYEDELLNLEYSSKQLEVTILTPVSHPSAQPFSFIDSEEDLLVMIDELEGKEEIAVDLEHHSFRSFQGFTCLMQVSTRLKNYVVDTLKLRSSIPLLLPIFTNPKIVKVFHGCDSDILWLQRDFGIYVVNCFDSFQAAKILKYPALSLAHLIKYHCGVILNKKHQLSDWRQRPLPEELIAYARDDTHYLLYVYDVMRKEISQQFGKQGMKTVLDMSKRTCLQRYEKERFNPRGYLKLLQVDSHRTSSSSNIRKPSELSMDQDLCLTALWDWRDRLAREQDESPVYIMSNSELLRIGYVVPKDEETLLTKCTPLSESIRKLAPIIISTIANILHGGSGVTFNLGDTDSSSTTTTSLSTSQSIILSKSQSVIKNNNGITPTSTASGLTTPKKTITGSSNSASSILTFLPAVSPTTFSNNGKSGRHVVNMLADSPVNIIEPKDKNTMSSSIVSASPVMDVKEIYKLAGWRTPCQFLSQAMYGNDDLSEGDIIEPPTVTHISRNLDEESFANQTVPQMQAAMVNINTNISQINHTSAYQWQDINSNNNNHKLTNSSASNPNPNPTVTTNPDTASSHDTTTTTTTTTPAVPIDVSDYNENDINALLDHSEGIPKSLVEIYDISNRNRQRNKHRKKGQGGFIIPSSNGSSIPTNEGDGDGDGEIEESGEGEMEVESYLTTDNKGMITMMMTIKSNAEGLEGNNNDNNNNKMSSKSRSRSDSHDGLLGNNNIQCLDDDDDDELDNEEEDSNAIESFYFDSKPSSLATTIVDSQQSQLTGDASNLDQTLNIIQSVGWISSDPIKRAQLREKHLAEQVSGASSSMTRGSSDGLSVNSDQSKPLSNSRKQSSQEYGQPQPSSPSLTYTSQGRRSNPSTPPRSIRNTSSHATSVSVPSSPDHRTTTTTTGSNNSNSNHHNNNISLMIPGHTTTHYELPPPAASIGRREAVGEMNYQSSLAATQSFDYSSVSSSAMGALAGSNSNNNSTDRNTQQSTFTNPFLQPQSKAKGFMTAGNNNNNNNRGGGGNADNKQQSSGRNVLGANQILNNNRGRGANDQQSNKVEPKDRDRMLTFTSKK